MEKLPRSEQAKVKKASSERLRALLIAEHYAKEEVEKMDREGLMKTWAEVLAVKIASGGAGDWEEEKAEKPAAVDPALEKTRIELERYMFDMRMKLEADKLRQLEEDRKLEIEKLRQQEEERKAREKLEEEKLRQQEEERKAREKLEVERLKQEEEKLRQQEEDRKLAEAES